VNVHQQPFLGGVTALGVQILERRDELRVRQVRLLREERPPRRAVRVRVPQQQRVERERHGVLPVLLVIPRAAVAEVGDRRALVAVGGAAVVLDDPQRRRPPPLVAVTWCDRHVRRRLEPHAFHAVGGGGAGGGRRRGGGGVRTKVGLEH